MSAHGPGRHRLAPLKRGRAARGAVLPISIWPPLPNSNAMQGKNREFAALGVLSRGKRSETPSSTYDFPPNSLLRGTGNCWFMNRVFRPISREFSAVLEPAPGGPANLMPLVGNTLPEKTSPSNVYSGYRFVTGWRAIYMRTILL